MVAITSFAGRKAVRFPGKQLSAVLHPRLILVCSILIVTTLTMFVLELTYGDVALPVGDVLAALTGSADAGTTLIVTDLRLPRALVGVLVGLAFGMSGAIMQSLTRNPLASPDIIGITEGTSLFAVAAIVLGFGKSLGIPLMALLGGLTSATLIYTLAWKRGASGYRIVLTGIGLSAVFAAGVQYMLVTADFWDAVNATVWINGSLYARGWSHLTPLLIGLAILLPLAVLILRRLPVLQLGDEVAIGLGVPVQFYRFALIGLSVGLVSVGTAAAGPILFVGLIAPQIAKRMAGTVGEPPLTSGLLGATLVPVSDMIARFAFPSELPVGVVTGLLGAPFLLWLLAKANRRSNA
ncbi:iron ABC transporter permease [Pseudonocardiaceae bacterium YIM PH 21723]|nr:iron ABC transporter permease [Pseudonocardiaceae bacterium YIM PH 21723]